MVRSIIQQKPHSELRARWLARALALLTVLTFAGLMPSASAQEYPQPTPPPPCCGQYPPDHIQYPQQYPQQPQPYPVRRYHRYDDTSSGPAAYAMFAASHYSGQGVGIGTAPTQSGGITPLGGTFGFFSDMRTPGPIRVGADVRLDIGNSANSSPYGDKLTAGFVGLRVDGSGAHLPAVPYVQFEVGGAGTNAGTSYDKTASFAYQVQFGADFPLLIPQLAGRLEYGAGQLTSINDTNHTLQTFGIGLVLHFR